MAQSPDKSEAILLRTRQQLLQSRQINHIKIIGIILDKNLSMYDHVNAVCKSVRYHIRALRHIRSSMSDV